MKEYRSYSQILFGYLPEQTVDLKQSIWKVVKWRNPIELHDIDTNSLRRELVKVAGPWRATGNDGGFVSHIEGNASISVVQLSENNGVEVERFPKVWICKNCNELAFYSRDKNCPCGSRFPKSHFHFVAYHGECGRIQDPIIPKCKTHRRVRVIFPGTASAAEIKFECPVCSSLNKSGFGFYDCECGNGKISHHVHRSASVYTPRTVVIVNPPRKKNLDSLLHAGGPSKALAWTLNGMENAIDNMKPSSDSLKKLLLLQGIEPEIVENMVKASNTTNETVIFDLDIQEEVESEAVTIALATMESRVQISELIADTNISSEMEIIYRVNYKAAIDKSKIKSIDLIEKFPVLTGHYGYTRGDFTPGATKLMPFRGERGRNYQVYADISETESLLIQVNPFEIANWLTKLGAILAPWKDERSVRISIINSFNDPIVFDSESISIQKLIFRLIHSYSHRFMKYIAVNAGIERNALSELLTPIHFGFFVYAVSRGDFVLGGLQAIFENNLHKLLNDVMYEERRCSLDPGCGSQGGACVACLHVGEPSCRYFNTELTRTVLFGNEGFLTQSTPI